MQQLREQLVLRGKQRSLIENCDRDQLRAMLLAYVRAEEEQRVTYRREQRNVRARIRREHETDQERLIRLENDRMRHEQEREHETDQERLIRLENDRMRHEQSRSRARQTQSQFQEYIADPNNNEPLHQQIYLQHQFEK